MTPRRCWVWLIAAILGLSVFGGFAGDVQADDKRIVFLPFKGSKAKRVRAAVIKETKREARIARLASFRRALGDVDPRSADGYKLADAARRIGLDGVISGEVTRRRGWYILSLVLRSAATGEIERELMVELGRRPRLTSRAKRILRREFLPAIGELQEVDAAGEPDTAEEPAIAESEGEDASEPDTESAESADGTNATDASREDNGQKGETRVAQRGSAEAGPKADESAVSKLQDDPRPLGRALDFTIGASVLGRRLSFSAEDVGLAPFEYSGLPMPAARLNGTIYPLALVGAEGFAANFGASFVFERVVRVNSNVEGSAIKIPTTHQRWGVGVHYRFDFGQPGRSPSIAIGGGYDQITFALDRRVLMNDPIAVDLPDVDYLVFYPELAARLPLGKRVVVYTKGAYLVISDAGPIENENAYGSASASGFDADLGFEILIAKRVLMRLGAEYTRISHSFEGEGSLRDRDGDGTDDVLGAVDQYFGGYLTAGFQF